MVSLGTPERALAIGAHPDDIEFGAGGTLARWARDGSEITMLIVTDGSKGTWDPTVTPQELAAVRMDEQREAARILGVEHVVFLGQPDGELTYSMELRAEVSRQIRTHRPEVVLGHDPWKRYELHPDHRATGMATVDGVVAARDHLFYPEHGVPHHRPSHLLLWSAEDPDHHEDIAPTVETKAEALLCHASQLVSTIGGDDQPSIDRFRAWLVEHAKAEAEDSSYELAERFKRLEP